MARAAHPEQLEIDFSPRNNKTLKFIGACFLSLFVVSGIAIGAVLMMKPEMGGSNTSRFAMPSMFGILAAVQSGGRINPYQMDAMMGQACGVMASMPMVMGEVESSTLDRVRRAQRQCRGGRFE